jgi:hypothetical protein
MFGFQCELEQQVFDYVVTNLTLLYYKNVRVKWVIQK